MVAVLAGVQLHVLVERVLRCEPFLARRAHVGLLSDDSTLPVAVGGFLHEVKPL